MQKSTDLVRVLSALDRRARALGLTDTQWSARAGLRKETLSRLRRRDTCDFSTLRALAEAVGLQLGVLSEPSSGTDGDGHFPTAVNRDYEEQLVALCASADHDPEHWRNAGPAFFVAGLAVMLASVPGRDRRALLALAERLHPGASEPAVFSRWLERSPVRPSRFLPMLTSGRPNAA